MFRVRLLCCFQTVFISFHINFLSILIRCFSIGSNRVFHFADKPWPKVIHQRLVWVALKFVHQIHQDLPNRCHMDDFVLFLKVKYVQELCHSIQYNDCMCMCVYDESLSEFHKNLHCLSHPSFYHDFSNTHTHTHIELSSRQTIFHEYNQQNNKNKKNLLNFNSRNIWSNIAMCATRSIRCNTRRAELFTIR